MVGKSFHRKGGISFKSSEAWKAIRLWVLMVSVFLSLKQKIEFFSMGPFGGVEEFLRELSLVLTSTPLSSPLSFL